MLTNPYLYTNVSTDNFHKENNVLHDKIVNIIVALDKNNLIGKNNDLPWPRIKEDMGYFQEKTTPYTVVMGRNTWDSIPSRFKPLTNRQNTVVSRNPKYSTGREGVLTATSVEEAIQIAETAKVFIIGGAGIYKDALPYADRLYLTRVSGDYEGDVYFPEFDLNDWALFSGESMEGHTLAGTTIPIAFNVYRRT